MTKVIALFIFLNALGIDILKLQNDFDNEDKLLSFIEKISKYRRVGKYMHTSSLSARIKILSKAKL